MITFSAIKEEDAYQETPPHKEFSHLEMRARGYNFPLIYAMGKCPLYY